MPRMIQISEKTAKVRALFSDSTVDVWLPLPNGFQGMLLNNGSIDLRHKVRLHGDSFAWRIDRITAKGAEKFVGYQPMSTIESEIY
jgi:hypothetical protein